MALFLFWSAAIAGDFGKRRTHFRATAATILGEIDEEIAHRFEIDRIDDRAAIAPRTDKARIGEHKKLRGSRVGRGIRTARDLTRRKPLRSRLHEQAKHVDAGVLRERGKSFDGVYRFHISLIPEMLEGVNLTFLPRGRCTGKGTVARPVRPVIFRTDKISG